MSVLQIKSKFDISFSQTDIFGIQSVAELTNLIHLKLSQVRTIVQPVAFNNTDSVLSNAQSCVYIHELMRSDDAMHSKGSIEYNVHFALKISGLVDVQAMCMALGDIYKKHSILRTIICTDVFGDIRQISKSADDIPFKLNLVDALSQEELDEALRLEACNAFDLARDPKMRCSLLRFASKSTISFCFHHLFFDGYAEYH